MRIFCHFSSASYLDTACPPDSPGSSFFSPKSYQWSSCMETDETDVSWQHRHPVGRWQAIPASSMHFHWPHCQICYCSSFQESVSGLLVFLTRLESGSCCNTTYWIRYWVSTFYKPVILKEGCTLQSVEALKKKTEAWSGPLRFLLNWFCLQSGCFSFKISWSDANCCHK